MTRHFSRNMVATGILALALSFPALSFAAADNTGTASSSSGGTSNNSNMTREDCVLLPSNRDNYSTKEYRARESYCNNIDNPSASRNSNSYESSSRKSSNGNSDNMIKD